MRTFVTFLLTAMLAMPAELPVRQVVLYKHVAEDDRLLQFKCVEFVEELIFGPLRKNPLPRDVS